MAKGTKIYTNPQKRHLQFLNTIENEELTVFDNKTVSSLCNLNALDTSELLENLAHKNLITRLERSKYTRYGFSNEFVIGCFVSGTGVISYWSALHYHGLTNQIPNVVFVKLPRYKVSKSIAGVRYRFVKSRNLIHQAIVNGGYGIETFKVTDKELTILDCFTNHEYSGGYAELLKALYSADLNLDKLLQYGLEIGNHSVLKRLAFLSELFEIQEYNEFRKQVSLNLNKRYTLIDPNGPDQGVFVNKWRIRLNVSKDELLGIINESY